METRWRRDGDEMETRWRRAAEDDTDAPRVQPEIPVAVHGWQQRVRWVVSPWHPFHAGEAPRFRLFRRPWRSRDGT